MKTYWISAAFLLSISQVLVSSKIHDVDQIEIVNILPLNLLCTRIRIRKQAQSFYGSCRPSNGLQTSNNNHLYKMLEDQLVHELKVYPNIVPSTSILNKQDAELFINQTLTNIFQEARLKLLQTANQYSVDRQLIEYGFNELIKRSQDDQSTVLFQTIEQLKAKIRNSLIVRVKLDQLQLPEIIIWFVQEKMLSKRQVEYVQLLWSKHAYFQLASYLSQYDANLKLRLSAADPFKFNNNPHILVELFKRIQKNYENSAGLKAPPKSSTSVESRVSSYLNNFGCGQALVEKARTLLQRHHYGGKTHKQVQFLVLIQCLFSNASYSILHRYQQISKNSILKRHDFVNILNLIDEGWMQKALGHPCPEKHDQHAEDDFKYKPSRLGRRKSPYYYIATQPNSNDQTFNQNYQSYFTQMLDLFEVISSNSWTFNQKGWYSGSDAIERLPTAVEVLHYDLWLKPYFPFPGFQFHPSKRLSFDGKVEITFVPLEDLSLIQLNSAGLQINQVDLWFEDKRLKTTVKLERFKPILNLQLNEDKLEANKTYMMRIQYTGKIQHRSVGALYYNDYVDAKNFQRTMLATLLEPSKAHKVFPCFDSPTFKATFQLTLVHPTKAQVFHNTLVENTTVITDQLSSTVFKQTPKMSTYLFAFAVGGFELASSKSKSGVEVRTISLKQYSEHLPISAKIAAKCIDSLENLLGMNFPFDKLDHLESPDSLVGAVVENVGLIIYRGLLSVPDNVSSGMKLTQQLMICHETAHQWFSGLTTAKEWSQMLLHESIAQFLMYKAVRKMTKNEQDRQFIDAAFIDEREGGLKELDRLRHPIIDKNAYFDVITYKAGAMFFLMLESVLGKDVFYKGLRNYLTRHKYSNADHNDLLKAFEQALNKQSLCSGITVRNLFEDYLFQPTYPILQIETADTRFVFNQRSSDGSDFKWNILIFVRDLSSNQNELIWLKKDGSICNSGTERFRPDPSLVYSFNTKGSGFVRVEYSDSLWLKMIENAHLMDSTTQFTLVMDLMSGKVRNDGKLMAQKFIDQIASKTGTLSPMIASQLPNIYDGHLVAPVVEQICEKAISWNSTSLSQGYLTHSVLRLAVEHNLCNVSNSVDLLFKEFLSSCFGFSRLDKCNKLSGDIREAVYCYAAKNRHRATMSNYLFWLNSMSSNLQLEYDEIPNVKHGLKCQ